MENFHTLYKIQTDNDCSLKKCMQPIKNDYHIFSFSSFLFISFYIFSCFFPEATQVYSGWVWQVVSQTGKPQDSY